jgi:hypothetical protein
LAAGLAAPGCVKTGGVQVSQPLQGDLRSYQGMTVVASGGTEHQAQIDALEQTVAQRAQKAKLVENVARKAEGADAPLELRLRVVAYEGGSKGARMFNAGGEAEITIQCELVNAKDGKVLTAFTATGNSARKSKTTVGGFDTSLGDDLSARAISAAGEQIIAYLAEGHS